MDSSTLTHIAAIVVGVVLTLALKSALQRKDEPEVSSPPASGGASKKKKKKKKSKGGGGAEAASSDSTPTPAKDDAPKEEKDTVETNTRSVIAPEVTNGAKAENGTKSKKKKKKGKAQATTTSTANSAPPPAATTTSTAGASNGTTNNQVNDDLPFYIPPESPPKPPPKRQEEEWIVEGGNKNKKKNRPRVPKPALAATSTNAPVAAGTESVVVDAKKIGIIIGPKGATMKGIEEATGCKLDINAPSKDDAPPKNNKPQKATVVLSGDKEGMAKARKAILELASKGYATILQSDGFGEFSITVHPRFLNEIVGVKGRTINAIQSTLDVKLTIPSTDWKPNTPQVGQVKMAKVGIAGSKDSARQAKAVIQSLMKYHHHEITHPGMTHEQVHVPHEFFHCVIGTRGGEIKHIRGNFKVDVYMPNQDSLIDDVLVVGKQANVDRAIIYIQTLIDRDTENRERKYNDEYYD